MIQRRQIGLRLARCHPADALFVFRSAVALPKAKHGAFDTFRARASDAPFLLGRCRVDPDAGGGMHQSMATVRLPARCSRATADRNQRPL
jgi:hypothetical protein